MKKNVENTFFFYRDKTFVTAKSGQHSQGVLRISNECLAQYGTGGTRILSIDENGSVMRVDDASKSEIYSYAVYGYTSTLTPPKSLIGFNGERFENSPHIYLLGAGYRTYSAKLHRFHSPDDLSPFDVGGLNSYSYCTGDPVNTTDPSGHSGLLTRLFKGLGNMLGLRKRNRVSIHTGTPAYNSNSAHSLNFAGVANTITQSEIADSVSGRSSVTTRSMVSTLDSFRKSTTQSLPENFHSNQISEFDSFAKLKKMDTRARTLLWVDNTRNVTNVEAFTGLPEELLIDSVSKSLVTQHNGIIKNKLLKKGVHKYPANGPGIMYKGRVYTSTQRIQRLIRERNN